MSVHPPRNSTQDEVRRHAAVSAIRESLFETNDREIQQVCQQMEAEEHCGQDLRDEYPHRVCEGMVVAGAQRNGCRQRVVPGFVERREIGRDRGGRVAVQEEAVGCVGENFARNITLQKVGEHAEGCRERDGYIQGWGVGVPGLEE